MAAGWGKVQNWAADVEEEEAQNGGTLPVDEFPSLEVAKTQPPKSKKKSTKMALGDFLSGSSSSAYRGPSDKDLLVALPTASRGKPSDGAGGGLGGGFKEYGRDRDFADDDRERRPRREEDMGPSRADEADDWSKDRKFVAGSSSSFGGGGGSESRGFGGFGDRSRERGEAREVGPSRADESDAWGKDKRYQPSSRGFDDRERGGFGDRDRGFGDKDRGFGGRGPASRDRPEVDSDWGRGRAPANGFGFDSGNRERGDRAYNFSNGSSRVETADRWTRNRDEPSSAPEGVQDRPSERPRLVLQPRTVEGAADSSAAAPQPKKSNPFGNARPREEVLKEKGVDYKKEELKLEHDASLRPDTEEEVKLQSEIELLKTQLETLSANDSTDPEELQDLRNNIEVKETHLLKLAAELDDEVKYAKDKEAREGGGNRGREQFTGGGYRDGERRGFGSRSRDRFEGSHERASGW